MNESVLIHPIFVHFPIAFYFLELVLLSLWYWKKDEAYGRFALFTFRLAYGFTLVAALSGLKDTGGFSGILGKVIPHFRWAVIVFLFQSVRALYWRFGRSSKSFLPMQKILAVVGYGLVVTAAYWGGRIVYD